MHWTDSSARPLGLPITVETGDTGDAPSDVRFVLTWETLEANRDRPRTPPLPEPSMLRVIRVPAAKSAAAK